MNRLERLRWGLLQYPECAELRALVACELTPQVQQYNENFRLCRNGKRTQLRGLHRALNQAFWARLRARKAFGRGASKAATATGAGGRSAGLTRGKKVHAQIERFLSGEGVPRNALPQTKAFIADVQSKGLRPLVGEFQLADPEALVGTGVDALMVDREGALVLIEIKTGGDGAFDHPRGTLPYSLIGVPRAPHETQDLPVSDRVKAEFQLIAAREILLQHYGVRIGRPGSPCMFVAHLPGRETPPCRLLPVSRPVCDMGAAIVRELMKRGTLKAARRKRAVSKRAEKQPKSKTKADAAARAAATRRARKVSAHAATVDAILDSLLQ